MANGDGKSGGSVSERDFGEFLSEMRALEEFRQSYAARHPLARIDREDPDVRRLTEALAYFTVRAVRRVRSRRRSESGKVLRNDCGARNRSR